MRILIVTPTWVGGLFDHIASSFEKEGNDVLKLSYRRKPSVLRSFKLQNIVQIQQQLEKKSWNAFNLEVLSEFRLFKPDIFISFNESYLYSSTIEKIQKEKCHTVNFVADNPFDPLRFSFFPISLKYYNTIFVYDRIWIPSITNAAPKSKILKLISGGGFDPKIFFPIDLSLITKEEKEIFSCDVSFTGESYGMKGEGGYRSNILDFLGKYNVKIWGDSGWKSRFPYYKNLQRFYQGDRLAYDQLKKLYRLSIININMPSPQIFTGFQPRTFEIAACKGFQIADWRVEMDDFFSEDELVTFKNIPDLIEKVEYFISHPEKRLGYIERMYEKVSKKYCWKNMINEVLESIKQC